MRKIIECNFFFQGKVLPRAPVSNWVDPRDIKANIFESRKAFPSLPMRVSVHILHLFDEISRLFDKSLCNRLFYN